MLDKIKREELREWQQWLSKINNKDNEKKSNGWLWLLVGLVVVAGGAFAVYKFLSRKNYDTFDDEEFDDYEEYEDDFEDLSYDEDVDVDNETLDNVEETLEGEESIDE